MLPFALTVFLGAFLLFFIQPLVGRFALPWFGGSASVWTGCLVFFQTALLAGYAYADLVTRRLTPARQVRLHLALIGLAGLGLLAQGLLVGSPVEPAALWRPAPDSTLPLRLLGMLAVTVGLPFAILASTSPLMQVWFARAHPGRSPYRLYALSNVGSLAGLLSYPFLIEPWIGRGAQSWGWAAGFLAWAGALLVCSRRAVRPAPPETEPRPAEEAARPGLALGLAWVGLAAIGSVLLVATTQQLSLDLTAGPFLWVLPLGLYLLTFVLCFEREGFYRRAWAFSLLALFALLAATAVFGGLGMPLWFKLTAYCGALFAGCLTCHGELYRLRPAPRHLGAFYLWLAAGGALGSFLIYGPATSLLQANWDFPVAVLAACVVAAAIAARAGGRTGGRRRRFAILAGATGLATVGALNPAAFQASGRDEVHARRSFFGFLRVSRQAAGDERAPAFWLRHGTTTHGFQYIDAARRGEPTSYYDPKSGLGLALEARRALPLGDGEGGLSIGMLGLGVGATAALAGEGDRLRIYEIDPDVVALAQGEGGYFSFLADSRARIEVVLGDARTSLENELALTGPHRFDLLAVDVFSGDAIPSHLLTEEAMRLFLAHLAPGGVLALHISNRHLDLKPVVTAHAGRSNLALAFRRTQTQGNAASSTWAVLSRDASFFEQPVLAGRLKRTDPATLRQVRWTDERNSLLPVLGKPE